MTQLNNHKRFDYVAILLYACIVIFGWINIYAACYEETHKAVFDFSVQHGKQLIWMAITFFMIIVILNTEPRALSTTAYLFYVFFIILIIVTLVIGRSTNGGTSWIQLGPVKIQPSEFAKYGTALALSKYMSGQDVDLRQKRTWLHIAIIVLIPVLLIFLQHDVGSAIVFTAFMLPLYRFGMTPKVFAIIFTVGLLFILSLVVNHLIIIGGVALFCLLYLFVWLNKPKLRNYIYALLVLGGCTLFIESSSFVFHKLDTHQQNRIMVLMHPSIDPQGIGYNVHQSKIAIGSGGILGKGFLDGNMTKADFVPEQETDFIFCTVGEEYGFLGGAGLLLLYLLLFQRLLTMAERQVSPFSRFYGYSVVAILFLHVIVNVGMVLGVVPVIGIPLPFFSYGGSSLVAFSIMLFTFIRQDADSTSLI